MKKMTITQLKAQVAKTVKANMVKIREASEIARLTATLKLEASPELFKAKVSLAVNNSQTETLQNMVNECIQIVASVPVYNSKTRTNRVWAGGHRYNYGTQIDLMYQLATGILYSCQEHKQLLLSHSGLNAELLEQVVKAFGSPMYYSRTYHSIVEAKPASIELIKSTVNVMQSELGIVVSTAELNANNLESEFVRGEINAHAQMKAAVEAIEESDLQL
jgi:hypothetical protein